MATRALRSRELEGRSNHSLVCRSLIIVQTRKNFLDNLRSLSIRIAHLLTRLRPICFEDFANILALLFANLEALNQPRAHEGSWSLHLQIDLLEAIELCLAENLLQLRVHLTSILSPRSSRATLAYSEATGTSRSTFSALTAAEAALSTLTWATLTWTALRSGEELLQALNLLLAQLQLRLNVRMHEQHRSLWLPHSTRAARTALTSTEATGSALTARSTLECKSRSEDGCDCGRYQESSDCSCVSCHLVFSKGFPLHWLIYDSDVWDLFGKSISEKIGRKTVAVVPIPT